MLMKKIKEQNSKEESKIICEKCGWNFGYARLKTNEWVCRHCNNIQKLKDDKEE